MKEQGDKSEEEPEVLDTWSEKTSLFMKIIFE